MPSDVIIPARTERHCTPCEFLKTETHGPADQPWSDYLCRNPDMFPPLELSSNPRLRERQLASRRAMIFEGKSIGRVPRQPGCCPLLRVVVPASANHANGDTKITEENGYKLL